MVVLLSLVYWKDTKEEKENSKEGDFLKGV